MMTSRWLPWYRSTVSILIFQFRNAELFDAFAHHGYLVAVRNDDAYRLLGIETLSIEAVDAAKQVYHDCCLVGIDLIGYIRFLAEFGWEEYHAVLLQQVVERIF